MKKQNFLTLSLLVLVLLAALQPAYTFAATTDVTGGTNGPLCNSGGYFTPSSITITSGDTITFSVPANDPYAGGVQVNGFPQGSFVVPRGGSTTTQILTTNVSYQGTWPGDPSCIKGSGTVTIQAASSPSSPSSSGSGSSSPSSGTSSSSSSSAPSTSKTTIKSTTTPATPTASTATTQPATAPETVVANTIIVSGKKITPVEGQGVTINQSQPLALSGTTIPNGKITLTIHSHPTTATVQANFSGDWSYTVTGLEPGNHTIYATVTDPTTNQTSASSKLLAFTIAASPVTIVTHPTTTPMKKSSSLLLPIIASLVVVLLLAGVVSVLKIRGKSKTTPLAVASPYPGLPQAPPANIPPQDGIQIPPTSSQNVNEEHKDNNS